MMHTLGTAAAACGINKSTVLRSIKAGKISATRNAHNEWQIDAAELHRVYPPIAEREMRSAALRLHASPDATLALKVAMAEERLGELKVALEDMRAQRDSWQRMAEAKLLPASTTPKSWWNWRRAG